MTDKAQPRMHVRNPETDEVLRRVGRNVVNFQQVELLLKYLNTHARWRAPVSQLSTHLEKQSELINRKTMGDLAGRLFDNVLLPATEDEENERITEAWFGFHFHLETDAEFVDRHDKEMRALVDARNDLVHHFLPRWHAAVGGDAQNALAYLDSQNVQTLSMLERLQGWTRTLDSGKQQHFEFLTSEEGQRQLELAFLRSTQLVAMLGQLALRTPREDGWMLLSTAGSLIKQRAPRELEDLEVRLGCSSLKSVLLATELFDVKDEPTRNGGRATVYRINDKFELQLQ
ncbi:MAG: hypothetical protein EOP24_30790 [Hyphomicrobiales bacterium]|nr:MAG: hypothetical protein EOP24_30790 [Hyphomicrobiales bacterium]